MIPLAGLMPTVNYSAKGYAVNKLYRTMGAGNNKIQFAEISHIYSPSEITLRILTSGRAGLYSVILEGHSSGSSFLRSLAVNVGVKLYRKLNTTSNTYDFILTIPNNSQGLVEITSQHAFSIMSTSESLDGWTEVPVT